MMRVWYVVIGVSALVLIGFVADRSVARRLVPMETTVSDHGMATRRLLEQFSLMHNAQIADLQMRVTTLEARPVYTKPPGPAIEAPRVVPVFPRNH